MDQLDRNYFVYTTQMKERDCYWNTDGKLEMKENVQNNLQVYHITFNYFAQYWFKWTLKIIYMVDENVLPITNIWIIVLLIMLYYCSCYVTDHVTLLIMLCYWSCYVTDHVMLLVMLSY
jgi:hypothetical protein